MSPTDKGGSTPESPETPEQPGEATPVEPTSVEPTAAEPSADESAVGEPVVGEPSADEPVVGEPVVGEPVVGEPVVGEPVVGEPVVGEPVAPAAPIGGAYPAPEDFASASAAKKSNKKVLTIIGVVAIIIIAGVAALLAVLFTGDDPVDPEAQIKAVTEEFVAINNSGKVSEVLPIACKAALEQLPAELPDQPPAANPVTIQSITDIKIDGDTATATVTVSMGTEDGAPTNAVPLTYANEDGWKVC